VFGARALSHSALEAAYDKGPRPKVWAERKILTRKPMKGKGRLAAATGLLTVSLPPAAVGMNSLMHRPREHPKPIIKSEQTKSKPLWREAQQGVRSSLRQRNNTLAERTPIHRQAQSYGVGTLAGSAAGGLTGLALKKAPRLHSGIKAGIVGVAGVTAGAATLPAQSKLMQATSHGQYKVTPTGVVRAKRRPVRPSRKATRVARMGGVEVPSRVGKAATYPGSDLTHGQKRARVMAAGSTPLVGDFAAAHQAGRMAPPNLRRKTEGLQLGGSVTGSTLGSVAGAYGGAHLARQNKKVRLRADKINAKIDERVRNPIAGVKSKAAHAISPEMGRKVDARTAREGPGWAGRKVADMAVHRRPGVARVGRALIRAHAPLAGPAAASAAVLGGMIGQSAGSTALSTATYGHALKLEDAQQKARVGKSQHNRHGSRVSKLAPAPVATKREHKATAKRKEQSAALSVAGAGTGLTALGATVGSKIPGIGPKVRGALRKVPVPALTAGAGLGAVNSLIYANIQHKEAKAARNAAGVPGTKSASFVPGTGWVKAKKLVPVQRAALKNRLGPLPFDDFGGPGEGGKPFQGAGIHRRFTSQAEGRKLWPHQAPGQEVKPKSRKTTVSYDAPDKARRAKGAMLGTSWKGRANASGGGGGHISLNRELVPDASVLAHEKAHLAPKRNPYRPGRSPFRTGSEEGRADFMAGRSGYPGSKEFHAGYDKVQTRMRAAGTKPSPGFTTPPVPQRLPKLPDFAKALRPRITPVRMGRAGSIRTGYLRKTGNKTVSVAGGYG